LVFFYVPKKKSAFFPWREKGKKTNLATIRRHARKKRKKKKGGKKGMSLVPLPNPFLGPGKKGKRGGDQTALFRGKKKIRYGPEKKKKVSITGGEKNPWEKGRKTFQKGRQRLAPAFGSIRGRIPPPVEKRVTSQVSPHIKKKRGASYEKGPEDLVLPAPKSWKETASWDGERERENSFFDFSLKR